MARRHLVLFIMFIYIQSSSIVWLSLKSNITFIFHVTVPFVRNESKLIVDVQVIVFMDLF